MRCVFSARGDSAAGARGQQGAGRRLRVLGAAPEGPAPEGSAPEGPAPAAGRHVPTYRTHQENATLQTCAKYYFY